MAAVIESGALARWRALVVDDSRLARYVLSGMLERLGFDVRTVDSAEAALRHVSESRPHIVFMDPLLPGMQGLQAVRKLRDRPDTAHLRIVMYTSQDTDLFAEVARAAGADDVFVKAADSGKLEGILERLELLPSRVNVSGESGNVVSLPRRHEPSAGESRLEDLLEPILERHREKLRQDLLSEFAILERYEERMRLETMRRIEAATERAMESIAQSAGHWASPAEDPYVAKKRPSARVAAIVAALCIGLAIGSVAVDSRSGGGPSRSGGEAMTMLVD